MKITPVILSGGAGTRLWPLSRADMPKQFIALNEKECLFGRALDRCDNRDIFAPPHIICSQQHRFLIRDILSHKKHDEAHIVMEPCPRNTAAACLAGALSAQGEDDIILIMPSDHYIPDVDAFQETVVKATALADQGHIVTFGVVPQNAHTGYGYIQRGEPLSGQGYMVELFHEKPDSAQAQVFVESGDFYWNSGIFMGRASVFIKEFRHHAPVIFENIKAAWDRKSEDLGDDLLDPESFGKSPSNSIDYAVLEKTDRCAVVPVDYIWSDLGEWSALWAVAEKDDDRNVLQGNVYTHHISNSYLYAQDGIALAAAGLDDIAVVAMKDAVYIESKTSGQGGIKALMSAMKDAGETQATQSFVTRRPWGAYQVMDEGAGYKVKRLTVHSGSRLSLQKHRHRSEHWVVVQGVATVTRDDDVFDVQVNESVYIPCGARHRLENRGEEQLEIIEVQTGDYLGEDDIIRLQDDYNREL